MPMYEYQCADCGHEFEELVGSAATRVSCPQCGSDDAQKMFSVVAAPISSGSSPSCGQSACPGKFT